MSYPLSSFEKQTVRISPATAKSKPPPAERPALHNALAPRGQQQRVSIADCGSVSSLAGGASASPSGGQECLRRMASRKRRLRQNSPSPNLNPKPKPKPSSPNTIGRSPSSSSSPPRNQTQPPYQLRRLRRSLHKLLPSPRNSSGNNFRPSAGREPKREWECQWGVVTPAMLQGMTQEQAIALLQKFGIQGIAETKVSAGTAPQPQSTDESLKVRRDEGPFGYPPKRASYEILPPPRPYGQLVVVLVVLARPESAPGAAATPAGTPAATAAPLPAPVTGNGRAVRSDGVAGEAARFVCGSGWTSQRGVGAAALEQGV
ncbi:hypothetical protein B0H19DRAFT_1260720 [Mycena capillaripes]|nr:hypothetical protein B0H19DRAFT_1260720 [Mycena capillaripes]